MPEPDYRIPDEPQGLIAVPALETAGGMLRQNTAARADWSFVLGELDAAEFAACARRSAIQVGRDYCSARGISFRQGTGPLILTGHQPALFHPGVWAKNFLVDELARSLDGIGMSLVVDSDAAGDAGLDVPRWDGKVLSMSRREITSVPGPDLPFESVAAPSLARLEDLCGSVRRDLETLPARTASEAFASFQDALVQSAPGSTDLGDLLTRARRRFEAPSKTEYVEVPVSAQCATDEFLMFFLAIAERMEEFHRFYNDSLDEYRRRNEIRSGANPFPNLGVQDDMIESPFWLMDSKGLRATLWLKRQGDLSMICHANGCRVELTRGAYRENIARLRAEAIQIRPKALVLTLFNRLFVSDLFVHGIGGAKYDRVTDEIARRFYGVAPPAYIAATATVWLETGVESGPQASVPELRQRLHTLEHNPDRFAQDSSIDSSLQPEIAALVREKGELVSEISRDGADKKALGARIRGINSRVAALLAPLRDEAQSEIATAEIEAGSLTVARHREFPYCYWRPQDIRDIVEHSMPEAALKGRDLTDGS